MSISREDYSNIKHQIMLPSSRVTKDLVDLKSIDLSGFDSATINVNIGSSQVNLGEDNQIKIGLEHSDDDVNFTQCTSKDLYGDKDIDSNDLEHGIFVKLAAKIEKHGQGHSVAYKGYKRYLRTYVKCMGDGHKDKAGTMIGIDAILRGSKYRPVEK